MDIVDAAKRSQMMAGIRSKGTKPELVVRKHLHSKGFRYRLHTRKLPGSPDIALTKYKVAIFVHGCFWHRHSDCRYATNPKSNVERWEAKFLSNIQRDKRVVQALEDLAWTVIVVWECELRASADFRLEKLVDQIYGAGSVSTE